MKTRGDRACDLSLGPHGHAQEDTHEDPRRQLGHATSLGPHGDTYEDTHEDPWSQDMLPPWVLMKTHTKTHMKTKMKTRTKTHGDRTCCLLGSS